MPIIDSGENALSISKDLNCFTSPFDPSNSFHVLETPVDADDADMSQTAFINKVQLQYFDAVNDTEAEDWSFLPVGILDHQVCNTNVRHVDTTGPSPKITVRSDRQVRVKTVWRSGEVSWVSADAM